MFNFGTGIMYATALQDATGAQVANATPVQFGNLQDVSADFSFEEKMLYGSRQHPIAIGRGKAKFTFKAKTASMNGSILSDLLFGKPAQSSLLLVVNGFQASLTSTDVIVVPPNGGTFSGDLGVIGAGGKVFKKVASAPAAGQYSVSPIGDYAFSAEDQGATVGISYSYTGGTTNGKLITITNELMGQAPFFSINLDTSYNGKGMTFVFNKCLASKFSFPFKNDDFSVPDFDFSAMADDNGVVGYVYTAE